MATKIGVREEGDTGKEKGKESVGGGSSSEYLSTSLIPSPFQSKGLLLGIKDEGTGPICG